MVNGAFSHLAATLAGTAPQVAPTPAETTAARLGRAAAVLRDTHEPELVAVADALDQWLRTGGDLGRMLGGKGRRGKRNELPHNHLRRQALAAVMRSLVADDQGLVADPRQAGKALSALLCRMPTAVSVIRERIGVDRVPTSEKSLVSLIRGTEP